MLTDEIIDKLKKMTPKSIDEKGYLTSMNPEDNLLPNVTNWNIIKSEIGKGQGSELKIENGRMKFCALHSSAALCVNNFATIKQNMDNMIIPDQCEPLIPIQSEPLIPVESEPFVKIY